MTATEAQTSMQLGISEYFREESNEMLGSLQLAADQS